MRISGRQFLPTISRQVVIRVFADLVLVSGSLILAMLLRFVAGMLTEEVSAAESRAVLIQLLSQLLTHGWEIAVLTVSLLAIAGVYSHRRVYGGRNKALAIGQAVALAYLIFAIISYFSGESVISRSVLLIAAVLSFASIAGVRLWPAAWTIFSRVESRLGENASGQAAKHVLVIGGAGYIGSALLPKLLDRGFRVRLLDALMFGTEPIQACLDHPNLEIIRADFRQVDSMVAAMRGIDSVIHLGAIVGDPACAIDEDLTVEINLSAVRSIAEVAKGEGVKRFIFASTCSVYGASDETLDEKSALNPVSLYARSKIAAERVLAQLSDASFSPTILRFGTIYGLSGRTRFDLVVNLLTAKAVVEGKITVMGGDQWRPFVHVSDAALAVLRALEADLPLVRGEIFNVGSNPQNYTIEGAAKVINALVPTAQLVDMGQDADRRNYRVSFDKITRVLGYHPEWTLEQGIRQVIDSIQTGMVRDYKDAKYSNVKYLKETGLSYLARPAMNWERTYIEQAAPSSVGAVHAIVQEKKPTEQAVPQGTVGINAVGQLT